MSDPGLDAIRKIRRAEAEDIEFDIDNWSKDFEACFPNFDKVSPFLRQGWWGKPFENRPRIKELNEQANAQVEEGYRLIEFFPDRDNKDESYILFGTPLQLQSQLSLLMSLHRMFESKDIGSFLGYTLEEYIRLKPRSELTVRIFLTTSKTPYYSSQEPDGWFSRHQVTIPLVDKTKLTYKNIRDACGSGSGQNWGEWTARAIIDLGDDYKSCSKMVAGGSTEERAYQNLEKFLKFTQGTAQGISVTKIDYSKGERAKDPYRQRYSNFEVYPNWLTVINSKLRPTDLKPLLGKKTLFGRQWGKHVKLPLYAEREPFGWSDALQEVLRHTTTS